MHSFTVVCLLLTAGVSYVAGQTYNYNEVLRQSILFYEAQRSGRLPSNNRIPYRGDSALNDRGTNNEDLTGGWYDAGDFMKFGLPMAQSATALIWGGIEFQSAYSSANELNNFNSCIRWPLDYFLKCHAATNVFYGQVGRGDLDHAYWGRPEQMTMARPPYSIWSTNPGSDVAADTAAAMAAGFMHFRTSDATYANRLLENARRLYDFAYNYRGFYHNAISDAANYYRSSSYNDELAFGAAWLYRATGEQVYLTRALQFASTTEVAWAYDWDSKTVAAQLLLFITGQTQFRAPVENFLRRWFRGCTSNCVQYTPRGLAWRAQWGSLRYASNTAFLALVARKYNILAADGLTFAREQIHYALGSTGRSFVCGYGTNPPVRPHHASSSCRNMPAACSWTDYSLSTPNPQTLWGALVGGPNQNDQYTDSRQDYIANEVTCDYNAGFQSAVAGLRTTQLLMEEEGIMEEGL